MPEIEACRKCAGCCHECIFLRYDKIAKLFNCLVYKNKRRIPVHPFNTLKNYGEIHRCYFPIENFFKALEAVSNGFLDREESNYDYVNKSELVNGQYLVCVCNRYTCSNPIEPRNEKIENTIKIEMWVSKNIPNFTDLVEILNAEDSQ